jgi:imidazole glycerol-phosphate synthase subunit HisH
MVAIVNYGVGNLASISNMFKKIGVPAFITSDIAQLEKADKIILPGIGAFDHCMQQFNASGLRPTVEDMVFNKRVPVLGVCVGCQMLVESSEEGTEPGLGWLKGKVIKFKKDDLPQGYKIPHMSWADTRPVNDSKIYNGMAEPRFYFVHSYHILPNDRSNVTAFADYGYEFTASVGDGHIQGVQFHPEKSHKFGMQLYANFAKLF